jgi:hypothetical protein
MMFAKDETAGNGLLKILAGSYPPGHLWRVLDHHGFDPGRAPKKLESPREKYNVALRQIIS